MEKQVDKSHYEFSRYVGIDRWASYHAQIKAVLERGPDSVLEIGVGDGVLRDYLKQHLSINYRSLDIDPELHPDIVGSVTAIPLPSESVDYVLAFEVLEHLPFETLPSAIKEIARIAKQGVIMSLPHFGPPVKFLLKLPFLPEIRFAWKIPFFKRHVFNGEHYWEIGEKGYPTGVIREVLGEHFVIVQEFIPFENQYHHFFVLAKRSV